MARVTRGFKRRRRVNKVRDRAEGFVMGRRTQFRRSIEAVRRSLSYAYIGRNQRKRDFRQLWITRISAAANNNGTSYSKLIASLAKAKITLNRKMLAEIAIHDPKGFAAIVQG